MKLNINKCIILIKSKPNYFLYNFFLVTPRFLKLFFWIKNSKIINNNFFLFKIKIKFNIIYNNSRIMNFSNYSFFKININFFNQSIKFIYLFNYYKFIYLFNYYKFIYLFNYYKFIYLFNYYKFIYLFNYYKSFNFILLLQEKNYFFLNFWLNYKNYLLKINFLINNSYNFYEYNLLF